MQVEQTRRLYTDIAKRVAEESYCTLLKVGAAIVTKKHGTFLGFNGTPEGFPNVCETHEGTSHHYVIHAEENALAKMAKEGVATEGSTVYITHAPCPECTKMLYAAGIREVFFINQYKGVEHLREFRNNGMKFWQQYTYNSGRTEYRKVILD